MICCYSCQVLMLGRDSRGINGDPGLMRIPIGSSSREHEVKRVAAGTRAEIDGATGRIARPTDRRAHSLRSDAATSP